MRRLALALLLAALPACAVLSDRRVAAGCQVADGATTFYALTHGATEGNALISGFSPPAILAFKLAFAYFIWKVFPPEDKMTTGEKVGAGALTIIGCAPVPGNIKVIRGLK